MSYLIIIQIFFLPYVCNTIMDNIIAIVIIIKIDIGGRFCVLLL